ncbi:MAG: aldo/keto reductase [Planctomycetota bacterium]
MSLSRRKFFQAAAASLSSLSVDLTTSVRTQDAAAPSEAHPRRPIPAREFGRTGRTLPRLGLGCQALGELEDHGAGQAIVERAYADGVRYFDTAPAYGWGKSEVRVGRGLAGVERAGIWINTKTLARTPEAARKGLRESLGRLKTAYVDSILLHAINTKEALREVLVSGVPEVLLAAKEEGLVRHIGISGHADPGVIKQALFSFGFDLCLVPVNPIDTYKRSFVKDLLPHAEAQGLGVVAMKVLAGGYLPKARPKAAIGALVRYALAQRAVHVAVVGAKTLDEWALIRAALDVAEAPSAEEQAALIERVGPHEGQASEWYKYDK